MKMKRRQHQFGQNRRNFLHTHVQSGVLSSVKFEDEFDFEETYNKKLVDMVAKDTTLFAQKLKKHELEAILLAKVLKERWPLSKSEIEDRIRKYVRAVYGYGKIDPLMNEDLEGITDIRIVGTRKIEFWYKGVKYKYKNRFESVEELRNWWESKLRFTPFSYSDKNGALDAYLLDGSRINIKGAVAGSSWYDEDGYHFEEGPVIAIRRFGGFRSLAELCGLELAGDELVLVDEKNRIGPMWLYQFMILVAGAGLHFLITGNTGSGKTTTANAVSEYAACFLFPPEKTEVPNELSFAEPEKVNATMGCVEEAPEAQPFFKGTVIRLWDRLGNDENSKTAITMEDNLYHVLRQFIQVLFIGEIRRPAICDSFREAVRQGNKLVYGTYHAESAEQALQRFEQQLSVAPGTGSREMARFDVASILKVIFYFERIGSRIRLKEVIEISGLDEHGNYKIHEVAKWVNTGMNDEGLLDGTLYFKGVSDRTRALCKERGIEHLLTRMEELARKEELFWEEGVSS